MNKKPWERKSNPETEKAPESPGDKGADIAGPQDSEEEAVSGEVKEELKTCPECGAPVEAGAKFCTRCAAPLSAEARDAVNRKKAEAAGVDAWALKAGDRVKRTSWWVKLGIPLAIIIIVGIVVALFVIADGHSSHATMERYLSHLKVGDLSEAYELLVHPGGKFSSFEYYQRWQDTQTDNLGRMNDFDIRPRKQENSLFGRLLSEEPIHGDAFVVTLKFKEESFNVNITAEDAGGVWPFRKYRLKLSEEPTQAYVSPAGAEIFIDDVPVGKSVQDEELEEALSLGDLPDSIDDAVEYARSLLRTAEYAVEELKRLASGLDNVVQDVQGIFDQAGTSGVTWVEVMDQVNQLVSQSKDFGADVARSAMHLYWIFGGGDDGSVRAELTRTENGVELNNLPEGYHQIRVEAPGMETETKDFYAPEAADVALEPTPEIEKDLKDTINVYYGVIRDAMLTGETGKLSEVCAGEFLDEETARMEDLVSRGLTVAAALKSVKYEDLKVLSKETATLETRETWDYTTYQGPVPISVNKNVKQEVIYTLARKGAGDWKIIERKVK